jgi:hypothetical protein
MVAYSTPGGYRTPTETNQQQAGYNYAPGATDPNYYTVATSSSPTPTPTGTDSGNTNPPPEDPAVTAAKIAAEQRQKELEAQEQARKNMTEGAVKAAFDMYGLSSLFPLIQQYAQQGLTEDQIYLNLRGTDAYKARFPAMEQLSKDGRAITEAAYIDYERKAAQMEQMYGLPKGMVMGSITDLLVNDVSAMELQDRIVLASADSITAPEDLKRQIQDYYGIDGEEAMRAYYLDPDIALPILQKQSAAARIGVQAVRAGVNGVGRSLAEELQGLGVTEEAAGKGFQQVSYQSGLMAGRGDVASQDTLIGANLKGNAQDTNVVTRAATARKNRFAGGGGFETNKQGVAALGSSSA